MALVEVIPLGGAGEIGKNCTLVRQGDDIIVIDCGLSFPHEEQYGVDIVIPDFTYLLEHKDKVRGIFLTHAHEDHVGAVAFLLAEHSFTIYATQFTEALLRSKLHEKNRKLEPKIIRVKPGDMVQAGSLKVEPILVTHSIPETCAMAVTTEHGVVLFTADFKIDFAPVDRRTTNLKRLAEIGEEGVVLLLSDSTNVDRPGWGPSESIVYEGLVDIFQKAPGRIMMTMFSSSIHRMQQAVNAAKTTGRKISVAGRRMDQTVNLCQSMGYLTIPDDVYVRLEDVSSVPPEQLVIFVTGSQGEPAAALSQMSRGEYSRLKLVAGDTILYSARPIPGNEGVIYRTVNRLITRGCHVILENNPPVHVSGHAYQQELQMMISLTKPFYIAPVHGEPRHQRTYAEMARNMGHAEHRIFTIDNGSRLCIDEERAYIGSRVQAGEVLIDQDSGMKVTEEILVERHRLAHGGLVVASFRVDLKKQEFITKPSLLGLGFPGDESVLVESRHEALRQMGTLRPADYANADVFEAAVQDAVSRGIQRVCRLRPVVVVAAQYE